MHRVDAIATPLNAVGVAKAVNCVPPVSGIYTIFIDDPANLPGHLCRSWRERGSHLLYLGLASQSLHERLVEQELLHRRPATFFRSLGAALGYLPPRGSLVGKKNQNNYRFSSEDTRRIVEWTQKHVLVRWAEIGARELDDLEKRSIERHQPALNIANNPACCTVLEAARRKCREHAASL